MDGRIGGQLKGLEGSIVQQGHLVVDTCLIVIRRLVLLVMIGQLQLGPVQIKLTECLIYFRPKVKTG